jgi:hypothetical protein
VAFNAMLFILGFTKIDICKVIPGEMLHFSENICVSAALKLTEMELCPGITSVDILFRYNHRRNCSREIKQTSET